MKADYYWQLFMETGAPEAYLLYSKMLKSGDANVFDDSRHCPESYRL